MSSIVLSVLFLQPIIINFIDGTEAMVIVVLHKAEVAKVIARSLNNKEPVSEPDKKSTINEAKKYNSAHTTQNLKGLPTETSFK